jgi:hypothetical protein
MIRRAAHRWLWSASVAGKGVSILIPWGGDDQADVEGRFPMEILLIIVVLILLFGGGFTLYRR